MLYFSPCCFFKAVKICCFCYHVQLFFCDTVKLARNMAEEWFSVKLTDFIRAKSFLTTNPRKVYWQQFIYIYLNGLTPCITCIWFDEARIRSSKPTFIFKDYKSHIIVTTSFLFVQHALLCRKILTFLISLSHLSSLLLMIVNYVFWQLIDHGSIFSLLSRIFWSYLSTSDISTAASAFTSKKE